MSGAIENKELNFGHVLNFISNLWKITLKYKFLLVSVTIIFAILLGFKKKNQIPEYTAKTTLLLSSGSKKGNGFLAIASQLGMGGGGSASVSEDLMVELAKSQRVVKMALLSPISETEKTLLIDLYLNEYALNKSWVKNPKLKGFTFSPDGYTDGTKKFLQDSILQKACGIISAKIIDVSASKEGIITLIINTENEKLSKSLCDNLVKSLEKYFISKSITSQQKTLESLEEREAEVLSNLRMKENMAAKKVDGSFGNIMASGKVDQVRLEREIQILNIMHAEITKNLELARFNLSLETPVVDRVDYSEYPLPVKKGSFLMGAIVGAFLGFILTFIFAYIRELVIKTRKQKQVQ